MNNSKYGRLLQPSIKLHRPYFNEMVKLLGIQVIYRAPKPDKHYTIYTEIESNYECAESIGCIFEEHPTQQTLKKIGWISELQTDASIIHVAYDLHGLQQGALFLIPSGLDDGKGRLFRVTKLSNIAVYPASIACEIVPEYENTYSDNQSNFRNSSFNLLTEGE